MTAHGVQHNQNIFVGTTVDIVLQTDQHTLIATFAIPITPSQMVLVFDVW